MEQKTMKLSDAIEDSIIVITDDVNSVSSDWVAAQFRADDISEGLSEAVTEEDEDAINRFTVDREDVEEVIKHISESSLYVLGRRKNNQFKREHSLTREDLKSIVRQLTVEDYSFITESINELHLGHILTVFITGKEFIVSGGRTISNLVLYIKVDDSEEGLVTVVGIHESIRPEEETHPYAEEFKEYEDLWN